MKDTSSPDVRAVADRLFEARRTRTAIAPIRADLPAMDIATAYAVQRLNVVRLEQAGRRRIGRKIGLTSKAVQQQLGVDQPDFGVLFDDMDLSAGPLVVSSMISPRIEAEFAFRIGRAITETGLSPGALAAHVEAVCISAEIVDSAIEAWNINIVDTVADNASCGGFVLGPWTPYRQDLDLPARAMRLTRDGEAVSAGQGAATLGDPLNALAWLADQAIALGDPLQAGEVVLAGALGPMKPLEPGRYVVEIDGFDPLEMRASA